MCYKLGFTFVANVSGKNYILNEHTCLPSNYTLLLFLCNITAGYVHAYLYGQSCTFIFSKLNRLIFPLEYPLYSLSFKYMFFNTIPTIGQFYKVTYFKYVKVCCYILWLRYITSS